MQLAIVIPYYNLRFFERTLRSLESQTNTDYTLYIGNDASPDDPKALISTFKKLPLKRYEYFKDNLGSSSLVKQWERCIALTEDEEWIVLLGDDDLIPFNFVKLFYENIDRVKESDIHLIRFASKYIDETGNRTIIDKDFTHPVIENATDSFYKNHLNLSRSSLSEHIFSRKRYEKHGFVNYPLAWHSDDKAWLDFTEFGQIYSINDECVSMRMSDSNISGKQSNLNDKLNATIEFYDFVTQKNILSKFNKKQQKRIFLDYCSYLKMQKKFNFKRLIKAALRLSEMTEFSAIFHTIKIYAKNYER